MTPIREGGTAVLSRMQRGLENLYRVRTNLDVQSFLVDESARRQTLAPGDRRAPEQLLVKHQGDEVHVGLFLADEIIAQLERHDPGAGLSDQNFSDFCLAIEGISHFVYLVLRAANDRPVSVLELELQAEVDKFVTCLLVDDDHIQRADEIRRRLFETARLADDLSDEERTRYRTAHEAAHSYVHSLHRRYLRDARTTDMLIELRHFYRMGLPAKLEHIGESGGRA